MHAHVDVDKRRRRGSRREANHGLERVHDALVRVATRHAGADERHGHARVRVFVDGGECAGEKVARLAIGHFDVGERERTRHAAGVSDQDAVVGAGHLEAAYRVGEMGAEVFDERFGDEALGLERAIGRIDDALIGGLGDAAHVDRECHRAVHLRRVCTIARLLHAINACERTLIIVA